MKAITPAARRAPPPTLRTEPKQPDPGPITIVVADDHALVRRGLRLLIADEDGLQLVAEARTVPDAERLTCACRPSVLVLDLSMPGGSSLQAIPRLLKTAPGTAIVALTMHADPAFARQALRAGALGLVLTEAAGEDLPDAIRLAAADNVGDPAVGGGLSDSRVASQ